MNSQDRNEMLQLVRSEIQKASSASRFQLTMTSKHIHNNVDAPFVFQPSMNYGGIVQLDGVGLALPKGWTVTYNGTGSYTITHNLNTTLYVAMVSPILSITLPVASVTPGDNSFEVLWTDTGTPTDPRVRSDTSFSFLLVDLTNKSDSPPSYKFTGQ